MNSKLERRVAILEKLVKEMLYADEYICDDCGNNPSEFFSTTIDVSQDGEDIPLSICSKCVDDDIAGYYADDPVDSYDDFYQWVDTNGRAVQLEKNNSGFEKLSRNKSMLERLVAKLELLGGLIGKTNATKEDCEEVINTLKDILKLNDKAFSIKKSDEFNFTFKFCNEDDVKERIGYVSPSIAPSASVIEYLCRVKDTEDNKITVSVIKHKATYKVNSEGEMNFMPPYSKEELVVEKGGFTITSAKKLANNIVALIKNNVTDINVIVPASSVVGLIEEKLKKKQYEFMRQILNDFDRDNVLSRIFWSYEKTTITGDFRIKKDSKDYSEYPRFSMKITYDGDGGYEYELYNIDRNYDLMAKGSGKDDEVEVIRKAILLWFSPDKIVSKA